MKKLKKVFAAFAVAAMSLSTLAFTGCDPFDLGLGNDNNPDNAQGEVNNPDTGDDKNNPEAPKDEVKGNYVEVKAEDFPKLIGNVDFTKIFGDLSVAGASLNLGVKADFTSSCVAENIMEATASLGFDYKFNASESAMLGKGTATLNAEYKTPQTNEKQTLSFEGSAYNTFDSETGWIYASSKDAGNVKINLAEIVDSFGGISALPSPSSLYAVDGTNVAAFVDMAHSLSIKIGVDVTDGIKLKISLTEESIWGGLALGLHQQGATPEDIAITIAEAMKYVKFNAFKFDLYFALDKDGKFAGASVVTDIDVKINSAIISAVQPPVAPADEAGAPAASQTFDISLKLKGSVEVYVHNEKIEIPSSLATDASYTDLTEYVVGLLPQLPPLPQMP